MWQWNRDSCNAEHLDPLTRSPVAWWYGQCVTQAMFPRYSSLVVAGYSYSDPWWRCRKRRSSWSYGKPFCNKTESHHFSVCVFVNVSLTEFIQYNISKIHQHTDLMNSWLYLLLSAKGFSLSCGSNLSWRKNICTITICNITRAITMPMVKLKGKGEREKISYVNFRMWHETDKAKCSCQGSTCIGRPRLLFSSRWYTRANSDLYSQDKSKISQPFHKSSFLKWYNHSINKQHGKEELHKMQNKIPCIDNTETCQR